MFGIQKNTKLLLYPKWSGKMYSLCKDLDIIPVIVRIKLYVTIVPIHLVYYKWLK